MKLALFPLELVVFPGEQLNLHIFEPRYRQLLEDAEQKGMPFGIPAYIDGKIMPVGTRMQLLEVVQRYPTGESDIRTGATGLFRMRDFYSTLQDKLYAGGEVEILEEEQSAPDPALNEEMLLLVRQLFAKLSVSRPLPDSPVDFQYFDIIHNIGLSLDQQYELLCLLEVPARQRYLLEYLQQLMPMVERTEEIRRKALMNGHFKNIIPPPV